MAKLFTLNSQRSPLEWLINCKKTIARMGKIWDETNVDLLGYEQVTFVDGEIFFGRSKPSAVGAIVAICTNSIWTNITL